jgi:hypothetical protein
MIPAAVIWPVTRDAPADWLSAGEPAEELAPLERDAAEELNNNHVRFVDEKEEEPTRSQ